jgi:heme A synthase
MEIIQTIHGLWRWVLAIAAIVLIVKSVIGLAKGAEYTEADRKLAFYFAMAVTVQFLLGAANLIGKISIGAFSARLHMEHLVTGTVATALSHMPPMFKRRSSRARFAGTLILAVLSILVAIVNVGLVRGSWFYKLP